MRAPVFRGNLIVSNLPSQFTSADLAALFDTYGLVLGAKIERWHDRPGGAQGMVDLAPATSVEKAIAELNGHMLAGNKLVVRRLPPRTKAAARPTSGAAVKSPIAAAPHRTGAAEKPPMLGDHGLPPMQMVRPAVGAPTRKVVVEYRAPTRRVTIPPRPRVADHG